MSSWEDVADEWIRWARTPGHDHFFWDFVLPSIVGALPPPGELTLDIGCGEGRLGRELLGLGHRVLGIEPSATLARAAREADPPLEVSEADAAALPLADDCADLAVSSMSLLNIDDLAGALREVGRVLRPGGLLVAATAHPFTVRGGGGYFEERAFDEERERGGLAMSFRDIHRPLEAITGAIEAAGLVVEKLREPRPRASYVAEHPEVAAWRERPALLLVGARLRSKRA